MWGVGVGAVPFWSLWAQEVPLWALSGSAKPPYCPFPGHSELQATLGSSPWTLAIVLEAVSTVTQALLGQAPTSSQPPGLGTVGGV